VCSPIQSDGPRTGLSTTSVIDASGSLTVYIASLHKDERCDSTYTCVAGSSSDDSESSESREALRVAVEGGD